MKVLILGGTQFIGRHIVEALLAGGHSVSVLTRGKTPDALPPQVERLRGDRDEAYAGLTALGGRTWDACVDVSGYTPRQVRPSAEALSGIVSRYVFISTGSVYGDAKKRPVTEENPTMTPAAEDVTVIDGDTYGPLKVTCENIVRDIYGTKATILRPQIVAGPHESSSRFSYWTKRASLGGTMLAPGDGTDHVQVIDGRDLARFTRKILEEAIAGTFNMAGHRVTWKGFMTTLGANDLVWVPKEILEGVDFTELPLYRPEQGTYAGLMDVDNAKAVAAGLKLSSLAVTVKDTRDWLAGVDRPLALSPGREAELIAKARR